MLEFMGSQRVRHNDQYTVIARIVGVKFTFQYGSINTGYQHVDLSLKKQFTFQYGSINTAFMHGAITGLKYLHSNMVQLIRRKGQRARREK